MFVRSCLQLLIASIATIAAAAVTYLVSKSDSSQVLPVAGNGDSISPRISADGQFVLFSSSASDLVTNDNAWMGLDVFLRDRSNNFTMLISENRFQTGGGNDHSSGICVSTNGRYVLFESVASDLVNDDTNQLGDIFVRDVQAGATMLASVATNGGGANNYSETPAMTPDGRYVAFVSYANNFVAGDSNNIPDLFVRDLQTQTTTLISVGATNANSILGTPQISADGQWVAFFSTARGMVAGVSNISRGEIYLRNLTTSTTLWPSIQAIDLVRSNMQFNSTPVPTHPVLSADGRYVTFACGWTNNASAAPAGTTYGTVILQFDASTLTTTVVATNGCPPDLFNGEMYGPEATPDGRFVVYAARSTNNASAFCSLRCWDRVSGTNVVVSVDLTGGIMTNSTSLAPAISDDGRFITFISNATNLVANSISNGFHLYRRDLVANTTELIDAHLSGVGATTIWSELIPAISANGRFVVFSAPDGNLVAADDNGTDDVFVRDTVAATNELISLRATAISPQSGNAAASPGLLSISADGNRIAYTALATNLIAGDTNRNGDVFVWDQIAATNQLVSVGGDGFPARGGMSASPQISAEGRYVLFVSGATNLVANDTNGLFDVFIRDLDLQTTTRVSVMTNGVSLASTDMQLIAMTPDAQRIVFMGRTNSVSSTSYPLFWRDLPSGETRYITGGATLTRGVSLSTNGQRVAYHNASGSVSVWSAIAGTNIYTSAGGIVSSAFSPGGNRLLLQSTITLTCYDLIGLSNLNSWVSTDSIKNPARWSSDERHVVFVTSSALVLADTNGVKDVYLCDVQTGTRTLISASANANASGNATSDAPMFSADGRFIVFRSSATNLLNAPTTAPGLFRFDRVTGSNQLVVARSAVPGVNWFSPPVISSNGTTIVFKSTDSALVAGDANQAIDAFAGQLSVLSLADGDSDGIPDWWLQQFFGHADGQANDLSRAGDDADGDGLTNLEEFLTGTNPTDVASALEIQITLTPPTGTNAVLSWPAQSGKSYRVQFRDDPVSGTWQILTTPVQVSGGQGWVTVNRTNQVRVFRVRLEP